MPAPTRLRPATRQASAHRWMGLLAVAAQRAFALSLLELPLVSAEQGEGDTPLGDLLAQAREAEQVPDRRTHADAKRNGKKNSKGSFGHARRFVAF